MSNGGFMSNKLACDAADILAAVAPVASVLGVDDCAPTRPIPIMMFNGTEDTLVRYDGGSLSERGVPESFGEWADFNSCTAETQVTFENGDSTCESYTGCESGATTTLCTIEGGGHTWPGGQSAATLGHSTDEISATNLIWDFFFEQPGAEH